jgi:hypothetical protein
MSKDYSVALCNRLNEEFNQQKLCRPMRIKHYDAGLRLQYAITGIEDAKSATVDLEIEKFVGGGFAGQVYRVKILNISSDEGVKGLKIGGIYAMKILIPPSGFSLAFRNALYRIGFQAPFQLQVNPIASREGALWQKFIRRAAKIRFGTLRVVNDIHATFVDTTLGSCGELSDWVDGRTWRLEVDDHMDVLKRYNQGKKIDKTKLGSPEYRAKREFMHAFVALLHDMGGHEFARQYEWSTCKSQPNCLKRNEFDDDPCKGLIAVDFRAGLALLPFLPMSPGDIKLIFQGLRRGSLVQFDRGDLKKLKVFIQAHQDEFKDMMSMFEELEECTQVYRNSIPDITHNHVRLLYSRKLWSQIFSSTRIGWQVKNLLDDNVKTRFDQSGFKTAVFYILGAVPVFGRVIRKVWGKANWRKHYTNCVKSFSYLKRAIRGKSIEAAIDWHRSGRMSDVQAQKVSESYITFFIHLPLSFLPIGVHKCLTNGKFVLDVLYYYLIRPVRLYFSADMREQWLRDMLEKGKENHILADDDAKIIEAQIEEPYIQKYLKSLAVHVCTLPVTQVVSVAVSWIYVVMHPELSTAEAMAAVAAILVLFQITPVSPGSLVRGLYVLYLVIRERNFKDYNIAVFLGFFKYIGYLAFPIQMAYRYPELARFMSGQWATSAVHIVPVFGEKGALLEHWVYGLFYNWPLTIRRRMKKNSTLRASLKSRYWHVLPNILIGLVLFSAVNLVLFKYFQSQPAFNQAWWFGAIFALYFGGGVVHYSLGASLVKRIGSAAIWGAFTGGLYPFAFSFLVHRSLVMTQVDLISGIWYAFLFIVFAIVGALFNELSQADIELLNKT